MKRLYAAILILIVAFSICACGKDNSSDNEGYILYYTNKDATNLVNVEYEPEADDVDGMIEEFIGELQKNGKDTDIVRVIPDGVEVTEYTLEGSHLYITFNDAYYNIDSSTEVLCRAAIVLTLTQIDGVDSVTFFVGEQQLTTSDGEMIGSMSATDFTDSMGNTKSDEQLTTFTLYFANETGDGMLAYTYEDTYATDTSMEKYIVEQLIKGPTEKGYYRTLSDQVELISVTTNDGICYVNFGGNFLTETTNVQDSIVIYSIVDSILEVSHVNSVQISVNGETNILYHANISLESPFTRNMDYVVDEATTNSSEE